MVATALAWSGVSKRRDVDGETEQVWAGLGVPRALNRRSLRRGHPWAEVALAVALVVAPGWSAVAATGAAGLLMVVYLGLAARAAARPEPVPCACFGQRTSAPVSARTVWRNVVLTGLAALAVVHAATEGSPVEALADAPSSTGWWLLAVAVAGLTVYLVAPGPTGPEQLAPDVAPSGGAARVPGGADEVVEDYVRTLTPHATLEDATGAVHSLVHLAALRAQLLFFVNPACGSCPAVVAQVPEWQARLPEIELRLVVAQPVDQLERVQPEWVPYAMYDRDGLAARMLGITGTPAAVLLGTDGMLAGGPVAGSRFLPQFVDDIDAELRAARVGAHVGAHVGPHVGSHVGGAD